MSSSVSFFLEVHRIIRNMANEVVDVFSSSSDQDLIELNEEEMQILSSINLTDTQINVLKKVFIEAERSLVFSVLCIIDGVAYTSESIPDLALVNRSTGEPINHDFLHDEFYEVLSEE